MENSAPCFECLERQIHSDFSPEVVFRYGVSGSAFPFGSSAVVQIYLTGEEENIASEDVSLQYLLVGLPNSKVTSLSTKINHSVLEGLEDRKLDKDNIILLDEGVVALDQDNSFVSSCKQQFFSRMITKLTPVAYVGRGSYATMKNLALTYFSGESEEIVVSSINALMEGKVSGQYGADFLEVVGYPALGEGEVVDIVRHPNISPILGILEAPTYTYLLQPEAPYTLDNILKYSPKALKSDWHLRFLMYQIISALSHMHRLGVAHGNVSPASILMSKSLWTWLSISNMCLVRINSCLKETDSTSAKTYCLMENCPCQCIYGDYRLSPLVDWYTNFRKWWTGEMSNYEYLLVLNKLAGRKWGDHTFHTVMPWVIDFTVKPNENSDVGWRDLTKSKWRLAKGDEQLDFTYSSSEIPHHVSDECLSELAVCSYKARRLPLRVLRTAVRSVYEPNEYPSSMQRLYQWTPDECIPEFYTDPRIFTSLHAEMSDLALPSWVISPEEFILLHRDALESDRVSQQIHRWIDITFGYKLSGQASIAAKNVMLPAPDPSMPKSTGRTQLFTRPHPRRHGITPHSQYHGQKESCFRCQVQQAAITNLDTTRSVQFDSSVRLLSETSFMEDLEEANLFCEYSRHLDPIYNYQEDLVDDFFSLKFKQKDSSKRDSVENSGNASTIQSGFDWARFLECFEDDDTSSMGFQEYLIWRQKSSSMGVCSEDFATDIFAFGCILAELYLKRPLFDLVSFAAYKESGMVPEALLELPHHVAILVEACIQSDWRRRPSAKCLLESQYFSPTIRSAYLFLAPLQLWAKTGHRLRYAAKLAGEGVLKAMGKFAAEMCASYCLPLITTSLSDVETESALCLLKEFLNCLKMEAIRALILPTIQKILQASEYSHLKVSILQDSFVRDLWKIVGKQTYFEKMHPLIISNLINTQSKIAACAASVALIGSSEELGVPITLHQTVLPLVHYFGKGLCADGFEALVRISVLLGETFISQQLLPLLRNIIISCLDVSQTDKPEPSHSLTLLTLMDCFSALDALIPVIPVELILKELIQEKTLLHVKVLMQIQLDLPIIQVAAATLIKLCQKIGPDFTAMYIIPQLKGLFDELVFFQLATSDPDTAARKSLVFKQKVDKDIQIESRMDLILLLYPFLASFIGIEKLRKCCSTWFFLEQILQRYYSWKWDLVSETSISDESTSVHGLSARTNTSLEYNQAKLLLNGAGWSHPQSQGSKSGTISSMNLNQLQQTEQVNQSETSNCRNHEPWFWFPVADAFWDGPAYLGRGGGLKDDIPWKIKASILYSARAHPGAVRSIAVCHDECTVYTAGVGPGFKGSVQKWELSRMNCISGYYGHEEVVNAICTLSVSGKIASCDGTVHIWNGQTGKLITSYAESSISFPLSATAKVPTEQSSMLTPNALTSGILSNSYNGSLYTCMHYIECDDKLVAGLGNGSVRYIDVVQGQKLHLWKSDAAEYSFSSLVSAICSCGSEKLQADRGVSSPSWIATGLSSGHCRLLDTRCGDIIAHWKAHDGYITKLAAPEDYLLLSSSLDKSLRVWDLRRNLDSQSNVFRGHSDGITSFAVWSQDVISISRNKIALNSVSRSTDELVGHHRLSPQTLYSADRGMKNQSVISAISILPFSRLFLVGTEDGYLRICC